MFDSLDEQMQKDMDKQSTKQQRMLVWLAVAIATVIIFGGIYYGVRFID